MLVRVHAAPCLREGPGRLHSKLHKCCNLSRERAGRRALPSKHITQALPNSKPPHPATAGASVPLQTPGSCWASRAAATTRA